MKLFEETIMGNLSLKNRFALAPMTTYSGNEDLTPSEQEIKYLGLRSHGPSLIISPAICVNPSGQAFVNQMSLIDASKVAPMKKLVDHIKQAGGIPIAQLHHGGRMNDPSVFEDKSHIVAPSAIKAPRGDKVTPREMTIDEIKQTVKDFASATKRAIDAGYQGIELHGANTYLLQQFFSPHSNQRKDEYGGSMENRLRFIKEVTEACYAIIKKHAPKGFIFGYRFSPEEIEEDGITIEHTLELIDYLKTQPFDYLHVSLRRYDQSSMRDETDRVRLVDKLQQRLQHQIPLMGAGGVNDHQSAKAALDVGLDYIAVGFSLLADPDFVQKVYEQKSPSKHIDKSTLPDNLYQRLYKNKDYFTKNGYTF